MLYLDFLYKGRKIIFIFTVFTLLIGCEQQPNVNSLGSDIFINLDSNAIEGARGGQGQAVHFTNQARDKINGFLFVPSNGEGPFASVVIAHGCGGLFRHRAGTKYEDVGPQFRRWASRLQRGESATGLLTQTPKAVLLIDSFYSRGFVNCEQAETMGIERQDLLKWRADDVNSALKSLGGLANIAADRIALMGFSDGGSTALYAALGFPNHGKITALDSSTNYQLAISYYPGCYLYGLAGALDTGDYLPRMPTLMLHGELDRLSTNCVRRSNGISSQFSGEPATFPIEFHLYEGAAHSFDGVNLVNDTSSADALAKRSALQRVLSHDWLGGL